MVFVFFSLASVHMIISRTIHVALNGIFHSFLWLSNIPLRARARARTHTCYLFMYQIFFVHSPVDGHLGCCHVLTAVAIGLHGQGSNLCPLH